MKMLCVILLLSGCDYSKVVVEAEQDAQVLTNKIDSRVYLSLSERQLTYDLIRSELEYIYVNKCKLKK